MYERLKNKVFHGRNDLHGFGAKGLTFRGHNELLRFGALSRATMGYGLFVLHINSISVPLSVGHWQCSKIVKTRRWRGVRCDG